MYPKREFGGCLRRRTAHDASVRRTDACLCKTSATRRSARKRRDRGDRPSARRARSRQPRVDPTKTFDAFVRLAQVQPDYRGKSL
jgi:hypothetical protein